MGITATTKDNDKFSNREDKKSLNTEKPVAN